jgi:uncharacterized protein
MPSSAITTVRTSVLGEPSRPPNSIWAACKEGRLARLRRRFPEANLVIFGHSHIPLQAAEENFGIFNPGSPTDKRRQPHRTLGPLEIEDGQLARADIVRLS